MKVAIFGADGFIGSAVTHEIESSGHTVLRGRDSDGNLVDLLNQDAVKNYLNDTKPEVIINCAGVVGGGDFENNVHFTENILTGVKLAKIAVNRVIIMGSAGEYGEVDTLPVLETTLLAGTSPYALSKIQEEKVAQAIGKEVGIEVVAARVFNPIGPGMHERFLIPSLLRQIQEVKDGNRDYIEVSRLDAKRDYIDVRDVATAISAIVINDSLQHDVYNIGSGKSTSNQELIQELISLVELEKNPTIIETQDTPEPTYANQADISRLSSELNWRPQYSLKTTMEDIVSAKSHQ